MNKIAFLKIKLSLFFLILFFSFTGVFNSQTKQERIDILKIKIDSLTNLVNNQKKLQENSLIQLNEKKVDNQKELDTVNELIQTSKNLSKELAKRTDLLDRLLNETISIGTQVWMTKNLNVSTFKNGDPIPEAKTDEEWKRAGKLKKPAWCYYQNDPANGAKYGKLYNWYAVNDIRCLAPSGYHITQDDEWTILTDYLGGEDFAGTKIKSMNGWDENGNGTNTSGFSGLPGGGRSSSGAFYDIGSYGYWWSSTDGNTSDAWYRLLSYHFGSAYGDHSNKHFGFSVRCVKD